MRHSGQCTPWPWPHLQFWPGHRYANLAIHLAHFILPGVFQMLLAKQSNIWPWQANPCSACHVNVNKTEQYKKTKTRSGNSDWDAEDDWGWTRWWGTPVVRHILCSFTLGYTCPPLPVTEQRLVVRVSPPLRPSIIPSISHHKLYISLLILTCSIN